MPADPASNETPQPVFSREERWNALHEAIRHRSSSGGAAQHVVEDAERYLTFIGRSSRAPNRPAFPSETVGSQQSGTGDAGASS